MISAVSTISLALARPTSRCRSHVPPPSGTSPILRKTSPNFARSEATIRSHPSAMLHPAPTAKPSTMAIVGFGKLNRRRTKRLSISTRARPSAAVCFFCMLLTSPPAEKWPPAPVSSITRTAESRSISSSAPSISSRIVRSNALRASGRFIVTVAMPSARSTSSA